MRLTKLIAVVACAVVAATIQTTAADAAAAPAAPKVKNGNIMFAGRDTINQGFYVWQVAPGSPIGSRVSTWIDGPQPAVGPLGARWARYSADGTKAAYAYDTDIVVRDVASGSVLQVLVGKGVPAGEGLDWSPDGTKLVLLEQRAVAVLDLASETHTTIYSRPNRPVRLSSVTWSPDGKWISFATTDDITNTIKTMHPDGTGGHTIVSQLQSAGTFESLEWSPDSSRVAYIHSQYDAHTGAFTTGLVTMDKKGNGVLNVSDLAGGPAANHWFTDLAWSPDGKRIAVIDFYKSAPAVDVGQVRAYDADGSSKYWLTALQRIDANGTIDWGRKLP